jgi:hypothetical protein
MAVQAITEYSKPKVGSRLSNMTFPIITFLVFLILSVSSTQAAEIKNLENLSIPERPAGGEFSLDQVRALISRGCSKRQWTAFQHGDGSVACSILVRGRHFVKVEIRFSEKQYSILYSDSREMNYNFEEQTIHRNYNRWVANLQLMIDSQFLEPGNLEALTRQSDDTAPDNSLERYEALLKLGELLERGFISEEEYHTEKNRLLLEN